MNISKASPLRIVTFIPTSQKISILNNLFFCPSSFAPMNHLPSPLSCHKPKTKFFFSINPPTLAIPHRRPRKGPLHHPSRPAGLACLACSQTHSKKTRERAPNRRAKSRGKGLAGGGGGGCARQGARDRCLITHPHSHARTRARAGRFSLFSRGGLDLGRWGRRDEGVVLFCWWEEESWVGAHAIVQYNNNQIRSGNCIVLYCIVSPQKTIYKSKGESVRRERARRG